MLGILGYFGIQTTSFAAMLAGAGVAIGAAWSGMLGNFVAGAFMLVLQPFQGGGLRRGRRPGRHGAELGLFATTIVTPDNVMTLVGNSKIFADTIHNYTARRCAASNAPPNSPAAWTRRTPSHASRRRWRRSERRQLPAPEVNLLDLNLVGTVIAVRPYSHNDHYWQVYFDTNEAIVRVCKEAGWPAPTPTQIMKTMPA